jgi:membrane protease YdiL (CAAX protease family)
MLMIKNSKRALLISLALIFFYKLWKIIVKEYLGVVPSEDYYLYEGLNTAYRYFGAILSVYLCAQWVIDKTLVFSKKIDRYSWLLILYLVIYFSYRAFFSIKPTSYEIFIFEFIVNFSVGFFEEYAFRGLLLLSLIKFMGTPVAIIISSVIFSIWHYDVYPKELFPYLLAFLFSVNMSLLVVLKRSLFQLAIFHFLFDQIYFNTFGVPNKYELWLVLEVLLMVMIFLFKRNATKKTI